MSISNALRVITIVHLMAEKVPYDLVLHYLLIPSPSPHSHSFSATLASLLFLDNTRHTLLLEFRTSHSLRLKMLFLQICTQLTLPLQLSSTVTLSKIATITTFLTCTIFSFPHSTLYINIFQLLRSFNVSLISNFRINE